MGNSTNYSNDETYNTYYNDIVASISGLKEKVSNDIKGDASDTELWIKKNREHAQEQRFKLSAYLKEKFGADSANIVEDEMKALEHYLKEKGYEALLDLKS